MVPNRTVEERVHALEVVVTAMSDKNADVGHLSAATEELAKSTGRVENALAAAASAQQTAREAKADAAGTLKQLAGSEHKYRRRSRALAGTALAVSLLATAGTGWFLIHTTNRTNTVLYGLCQQRHSYDEANHESVGADVTYYQRQLHLIRANRANTEALIRSFPPRRAAAFRLEVRASTAALRTALAAKRKAFAAGVVGQCDTLPH